MLLLVSDGDVVTAELGIIARNSGTSQVSPIRFPVFLPIHFIVEMFHTLWLLCSALFDKVPRGYFWRFWLWLGWAGSAAALG
jgi:hypothetical protein